MIRSVRALDSSEISKVHSYCLINCLMSVAIDQMPICCIVGLVNVIKTFNQIYSRLYWQFGVSVRFTQTV